MSGYIESIELFTDPLADFALSQREILIRKSEIAAMFPVMEPPFGMVTSVILHNGSWIRLCVKYAAFKSAILENGA